MDENKPYTFEEWVEDSANPFYRGVIINEFIRAAWNAAIESAARKCNLADGNDIRSLKAE